MRSWYVQNLTLFALLGLGLLGTPVHAQLRSDLHLFSDSFISPSFEANQRTNYQFVGMSLKSSPGSEEAFNMDLRGAVAFGAPLLNYLNISEAYFQTKQSENEILYVGRKLMLWNDLDERWNFGLWQPLFQWNPLSSEPQGLTGIFWQAERGGYGILIFASPIYIPNQGPNFEIADGSFVRGNPWFRRPPESVRIFEEVTQVDYSFERPVASEIVLKASYGARLNFGDPDSVVGQLSYVYKPSNELAIGYNGVLDTHRLRGVVELKPQVFYHSLSGLDLSHLEGMFRLGASVVWDRPQKDYEFDGKWTYPTFQDAVLVSPFVEMNQKSWSLSLQSLTVSGGGVSEVGDMASASRGPLNMRYPFQQAVKLALDTRHTLKGIRQLRTRSSYTLSDKNDFEYFQWKADYRLTSVWSCFSELELVRAGDVSVKNQNEIAQYKNLDRFLVGATYVF